MDSSTAWSLFAEHVFLLVHLCDRTAFARLPQPKRAAFMDELMRITAQGGILGYAANAGATPPNLPSPHDFLEEMQVRSLEYATCEDLISQSIVPEEQSGTVIGLFFSKLPEPCSTQLSNDPFAIVREKLNVSSALQTIDIENQLTRVLAG